jgi:hypothetical protein
MEINRIRFTEHLAIDSQLSLQEFCSAIQQRLGLPDFEFDYENETEWGLVEYEGIEYNVSRPYEPGTLQGWDETVAAGCNFKVTLTVGKERPSDQDIEWSSAELVPSIGQVLAELFDTPVYHHRTWLGAGKNLTQKKAFYPKGV